MLAVLQPGGRGEDKHTHVTHASAGLVPCRSLARVAAVCGAQLLTVLDTEQSFELLMVLNFSRFVFAQPAIGSPCAA